MYSDDVKNGLGKYTYMNGTVYDGEFVNGEYEGAGKCTYADGDEYIGALAAAGRADVKSARFTFPTACPFLVTEGQGHETRLIDGLRN